MIIPRFWAEGRVQHKEKGRQVTVRRLGWSQSSEAEAQANAETRAREALQRILSGEELERSERRVPYNGAEGVPICEEVVAEHGETIITRNSYGARCLNTPNVLFADIDFESQPRESISCFLILVMVIGAAVGAWKLGSLVWFIPLGLAGVAAGVSLAYGLHKLHLKLNGGAEKMANNRINSFITAHPNWTLRVYRTPAGLRVLAVHRTFAPDAPEVALLFKWLKVDPVYVKMCQRQQCFRARVSPKPWRIGVASHMKPRSGRWPPRPESMSVRREWIETYEQKSTEFSACRFERETGKGVMNRDVDKVIFLHDELSRALTGLPIA
ncbi:MAG: AtpZ/AtpI family protein [Verrucomicrobiota bacterium]